MGAVPTPVRATVRDLLGDLVGKPVGVTAALQPQALGGDRPSFLAAYRFDDGRIASAAVVDFPAAVALGASIGFMAKSEAELMLDESGGELAGDLLDFFKEVVNVFAKLLNSPTSPHVVLREVSPVPGEVRADVARVALRPRTRSDFTIAIDGFDPGVLTVLGG